MKEVISELRRLKDTHYTRFAAMAASDILKLADAYEAMERECERKIADMRQAMSHALACSAPKEELLAAQRIIAELRQELEQQKESGFTLCKEIDDRHVNDKFEMQQTINKLVQENATLRGQVEIAKGFLKFEGCLHECDCDSMREVPYPCDCKIPALMEKLKSAIAAEEGG